MVYLRVKPHVVSMVGEQMTLGDVADVIADARLALFELPVSLPKGAGTFAMDALQLIVQIHAKWPDEIINVLGNGMGWLCRETRQSRDLRHRLRAVTAFITSFGKTVARG